MLSNINCDYHLYHSLSCAINTGATVLITGGLYSPSVVVEYSESGATGRDLPQLLQGRWSHGCSYYHNQEGTKVCIHSKIMIVPTIILRHSWSLVGRMVLVTPCPPQSYWRRQLPPGSWLESFLLLAQGSVWLQWTTESCWQVEIIDNNIAIGTVHGIM